MAKKPRARRQGAQQPPRRQQARRPQARGPQAKPPRRGQQLLIGGIILALVIGIGLFLRYRQQSRIPPQLQGALDNHYTRGTAGAPVVIKEFSDYT